MRAWMTQPISMSRWVWIVHWVSMAIALVAALHALNSISAINDNLEEFVAILEAKRPAE